MKWVSIDWYFVASIADLNGNGSGGKDKESLVNGANYDEEDGAWGWKIGNPRRTLLYKTSEAIITPQKSEDDNKYVIYSSPLVY